MAAPSASRVVSVAASQVGYYVRPGGRTKFGIWYGIPTGPWCAMFLSWVAQQTGAQGIIPKHAYTPAGAQWFRNAGRWHAGRAGIRRGDIVYFDFPGAPNRISHVGIVESVNSDGSVNTIEGNTSGAGGSQSNGGHCIRKRRLGYIVGYGRPAYGQASGSAPAPAAPAAQDTNADGSRRLVIDGDRGRATIGRWQEVMGTPIDFGISSGYSSLIAADQRFLNSVVSARDIANLTGRSSLGVDGDEGPKTVKVRQYWLHNALRAHLPNLIGRSSLSFDGALGSQTNKVHQFALNNARRGSGRYPA